MKILGVITARGGSKGLPRKNIRSLHGKPLIEYTIQAALAAVDVFHRVIVSTEDAEIAEVSRRAGADVPFLRPQELARDSTPTLPVLQHAVEYIERCDGVAIDWVMILQPTSPLRTKEDIQTAVNLAAAGDCDTVVSVQRANKCHPYKMKKMDSAGRLVPFIDGSVEPVRRQDLTPDAYQRNGAIYLVRRDRLLENRLYGDSISAYIMPDDRSVDIDTHVDFLLAEALLSCRMGGGGLT
jgi:CMP-N,N'-diacetyllegionaminic acid synthase